MNIHFKTHFPWPGADGQPEPTHFVQKILAAHDITNGSKKLHTIRRLPANGQPRYREGMKLVMCTGSRFNPDPFLETECTGIQILHMEAPAVRDTLILNVRLVLPATVPHLLGGATLERLARNDGFTSLEQFSRWFLLDVLMNGPGYYNLVHWADVRY